MARLFIAIDLPADVRLTLAALQPPRSAGVRLTGTEQMHVTLHYIGDADSSRIEQALCTVSATTFSLSVRGVGMFPSADGAITLWAGIGKSNGLLRLHESVAAALASEGYRPETRPYTPHVTLARCEPAQAACEIDDFLSRHANFNPQAIPVTGFGLYSSEFVDGVPTYRRERFFPLIGADPEPEL
jgi:2'-5' RNA ligase